MGKYNLVKKQPKDLNKFKVTIVADSNDGDYITTNATYTKEDFEEYVIDGLIDLKGHSGHYQLQTYSNEYDLEIPFNGWDGFCHSLKEVIVEYTDENGEVFTVEY
jgi:hypothetical protein